MLEYLRRKDWPGWILCLVMIIATPGLFYTFVQLGDVYPGIISYYAALGLFVTMLLPVVAITVMFGRIQGWSIYNDTKVWPWQS